MWEIREYNKELFWNGDRELMPLIKRVYELPVVNFLFAIEDKMYTLSAVSPKDKIIAVEEIDDIEAEPDTTHGEEFVCPYCKTVDEAAFEISEPDGIAECIACGSILDYTIDVSTTYTVSPVSLGDITDL